MLSSAALHHVHLESTGFSWMRVAIRSETISHARHALAGRGSASIPAHYVSGLSAQDVRRSRKRKAKNSSLQRRSPLPTCRSPSSASAAFHASFLCGLKNANTSLAPPAVSFPLPPCLRCSHCCEGPKSLLALGARRATEIHELIKCS